MHQDVTRCGALLVIADVVALEQEIILVKPEVNRLRSGRDISDRIFAHYTSLGMWRRVIDSCQPLIVVTWLTWLVQ